MPVSLTSFGSSRRDDECITSKQVSLLVAKAHAADVHGTRAILEFVEYTADAGLYYRLEDIPKTKFQQILTALEFKGNQR